MATKNKTAKPRFRCWEHYYEKPEDGKDFAANSLFDAAKKYAVYQDERDKDLHGTIHIVVLDRHTGGARTLTVKSTETKSVAYAAEFADDDL